MAWRVASDVIATLLAEAAKAGDTECCGLLLGYAQRIDEARPAANVAQHPQRRFEIDPLALLRAHRAERNGASEVLGYYHSHPNGYPAPSAEDRAHASGDSRVWAIIAGGRVTFWTDEPGGFASLAVVEETR